MPINSAVICGRLTKDADMRITGKGVPVANFTVAVDKFIKAADGWDKETAFIPVSFFGERAYGAEPYLKKGACAVVSGRLDYQTWEAEDGRKQSKVYVWARDVQVMLQSKKTENAEGGASYDE